MEIKKFLFKVAKQSNKIIINNFTLNMDKEWKTDGTPLTESDLKINELFINSVKKYFPQHGILAEEGGNIKSLSEYTWLCDPVDGTIPFSLGIPTCVFAACLLKNGEPIVTIIADPFFNRYFYAEKGKGAYLNNIAIHVSQTASLEKQIFGTLAWTTAKYDLKSLPEKLVNNNLHIINTGSTINMGTLVASGNLIGIA